MLIGREGVQKKAIRARCIQDVCVITGYLCTRCVRICKHAEVAGITALIIAGSCRLVICVFG